MPFIVAVDANIWVSAVTGHATHIVSRDEDVTRDANVVHYLQERGIQALTISRFLRELEK